MLKKNFRIGENIIEDSINPSLPIAKLSITNDRRSYKCMHAATYQCILTEPQKPYGARFLAATSVMPCHVIIFWDPESKNTVITHFRYDNMCEESLSFALKKLTSCSTGANLRVSFRRLQILFQAH